jgi:hypothetical protein
MILGVNFLSVTRKIPFCPSFTLLGVKLKRGALIFEKELDFKFMGLLSTGNAHIL